MFSLYDVVRVKKKYPELQLTPTDIGTVVDVLANGKAYTVEFVNEDGESNEKALLTEFQSEELEKADITN